ncbi:MAG: hypothetical protein ILA06_02145 [Bacteroidaceae bacterium]|nr:hypothetical protein [Bacteroidaceae bacterium]
MEKKIYSKPVLTAEAFEPQEYCSACWYVTIHCQGVSPSQGHLPRYIYDATGTTQIGNMMDNKHEGHDMTVHLRLEDGVTPTIDNVDQIISASDPADINDFQISRARSTSGQEWFDGWAWWGGNIEGIHFAEVPVISRDDSRPNHS